MATKLSAWYMFQLLSPLAAIAFFEEVIKVAESEGHHPDLHLTSYRDVKV